MSSVIWFKRSTGRVLDPRAYNAVNLKGSLTNSDHFKPWTGLRLRLAIHHLSTKEQEHNCFALNLILAAESLIGRWKCKSSLRQVAVQRWEILWAKSHTSRAAFSPIYYAADLTVHHVFAGVSHHYIVISVVLTLLSAIHDIFQVWILIQATMLTSVCHVFAGVSHHYIVISVTLTLLSTMFLQVWVAVSIVISVMLTLLSAIHDIGRCEFWFKLLLCWPHCSPMFLQVS